MPLISVAPLVNFKGLISQVVRFLYFISGPGAAENEAYIIEKQFSRQKWGNVLGTSRR